MMAYLEDLTSGGGEPVMIDITKDGDELVIIMTGLRIQNRAEFALHVRGELINGEIQDKVFEEK